MIKMNQEQNNLNQNNFNIQGNNGIPNNQPLNNQSFNQDMSFNQQTINSQPQSTPSFQQPINQMNRQQPTSQPINNFESGNVNNKSLNSKSPKKNKIGLIIGIGVVIVVSVICFLYFLLKNDNNKINDETNVNNNPAKQISDNPGTINHFSFEMNDKKYEFTSKNNIYLYGYSQYKNFYEYEDENGIVGLMVDINGEPLLLTAEFDTEININTVSTLGKKVAEKNGVQIFLIETENPNVEQYDILWNGFLWSTTGVKRFKEYGLSTDFIFEKISGLIETIKEVNDDNTLGNIDDVIISTKIFDSYRFALRDQASYSARFNIDLGNSEIIKDSIQIDYTVVYNEKRYNLEYESNVGTNFQKDSSEIYEDVEISFGNQKVYKYTDNLYFKNYVVISNDMKSRLLIHPSIYGDMSDEDLKQVLSIAFEKSV